MSLTVADVQTLFDRYIGDASTNRVTAADRLGYITEATIWLQEELKNDHQIKTYELSYVDTVNYYLVTTPLADLFDGADLRRRVGQNYNTMTHKTSRELAEEISNGIIGDDSWAIERLNGQTELAINATPQFRATNIDNFDGGVSAWTADTVNSDATNVVLDVNETFSGNGSLSYDVNVSQSSNNRATITSTAFSIDLSYLDSTGVFLIDAYLPEVTHISSYTLFWGTDSSNYWSTTVTTDINGNALAVGWQTLAFDWLGSTKTGSPTDTITYFRVDLNYTVAQTNITKCRYDSFRVAKPETLTFYYVSWIVGTDTTGANNLYKFAATSDIPYFSGKYDQYKQAVAHQAAAICFYNLRLPPFAQSEETLASKALERARRAFPMSVTKPVKSFKVQGINLGGRNVGRSTLNNVNR